MNLKIIPIIFALILVSNFASAITGSIGNARMILRAEVVAGETTNIEKSILVKNVNDVPINIRLSATEDMEDLAEIFDDEFTLQAGEEKKAGFVIRITKPGSYAGKINVFFTPTEEKGAGVVLSSTIIVTASGEGDFPEEEEEIIEEEPEEEIIEEELEEEEEEGVSVTIGGAVAETKSDFKINPLVIILIILGGIVAGFVLLLRKTNE